MRVVQSSACLDRGGETCRGREEGLVGKVNWFINAMAGVGLVEGGRRDRSRKRKSKEDTGCVTDTAAACTVRVLFLATYYI